CAPGAANWTQGNVHPDVHAIVLDPTDGRTLWVASDGGLARSNDAGAHWDHPNSGIATSQFYKLCADRQDASIVIGGMQDNGTGQASNVAGSRFWQSIETGDGAACVVNLKDPNPDDQFAIVTAQEGYVERIDADGTHTDSFYSGSDCDGYQGCGDRSGFVTVV